MTIARVTPAGLEITHAEGRGRIDAADLDATWQNRFQWDDAERQALLDKERKDREAFAPAAAPKPVEPAAVVVASDSDPVMAEKIQKLRIELIAWNQRVTTLSTQHSEAAGQSGNSEHPSVPGSLETWAARASRLSVELGKARSNQSDCRTRLRAVAPEDPLLKATEYR